MGMRSFRSMVSCVLLLIVPLTSLAADSGAAMLYADGAAWLNGSLFPNSAAIFSGDLVQTRFDSAANIHAPGTTITVLGDSLVKFEGTSFDIQHGGVSISTSKAVFATAGSVRVSPASNSWTEFNVFDTGGIVHIAARRGDLTIADDSGTTTLQQGQETTRDDQSNQTGTTKQKKGHGANGPPSAAKGGLLGSTAAVAIAAGAAAGLTIWVVSNSSNPVSPSNP